MARELLPRERIGEMLVSLGLITRAQLEQALDAQATSKLPIGKQLVALGCVSETRLTQVLSNQLSVPWVSLERVDFSVELLGRIPAEIADRCSTVPVYVRSVRGRGATLYVAMDDPTDEQALREIADASGLPVRPMIAAPTDLRRTIEQRYFGAPAQQAGEGGSALGPGRSVAPRPVPGPKSLAAGDIPHERSPKARRPPPPPAPPAARPDGVVAVEQYDAPSQPPPAANRTLTLLDGTQIKLPSGKTGKSSPDIRLVRQLVKAVRSARAQEGREEPMRWHDIVQALLDSLEARGVRLTREEIGEAWLRQVSKSGQQRAQ